MSQAYDKGAACAREDRSRFTEEAAKITDPDLRFAYSCGFVHADDTDA